MIKALVEENPKIGTLLALKVGVPVDNSSVNKKVMALTDPGVISMGLNQWSEIICDHQTQVGLETVANRLRMEISRLSNIISTFDLSIEHKETIATYFNDIIIMWVKSNHDIALRRPLDSIAQELKAEYVSIASIASAKTKANEDEEARKKAEKLKSQSKWVNNNDYPKARFEKT